MKTVCVAVGVLCLALACPVQADTLNLKNGTAVQGSVLRYEKGTFTVDEGGENPRTIRISDVESVEFEDGGDGNGNQVAAAKPAPRAAPAPQAQVANDSLDGDELDAWKLARSHIAQSHDNWMPDNASPNRNAIRTTDTGDYLVAIPVATKPEPGYGQSYGIFYVQVTKFGTTLRVDGDNFQKTEGPFRPQQKPNRRKK